MPYLDIDAEIINKTKHELINIASNLIFEALNTELHRILSSAKKLKVKENDVLDATMLALVKLTANTIDSFIADKHNHKKMKMVKLFSGGLKDLMKQIIECEIKED